MSADAADKIPAADGATPGDDADKKAAGGKGRRNRAGGGKKPAGGDGGRRNPRNAGGKNGAAASALAASFTGDITAAQLDEMVAAVRPKWTKDDKSTGGHIHYSSGDVSLHFDLAAGTVTQSLKLNFTKTAQPAVLWLFEHPRQAPKVGEWKKLVDHHEDAAAAAKNGGETTADEGEDGKEGGKAAGRGAGRARGGGRAKEANADEARVCSLCKESKPGDQYSRNQRSRGNAAKCNTCCEKERVERAAKRDAEDADKKDTDGENAAGEKKKNPRRPRVEVPETLVCSVCTQTKPSAEYSRNQQSKGEAAKCKACMDALGGAGNTSGAE